MGRWLQDPDTMILKRYPAKVFSPRSWDNFHAFLDSVEARETDAIRKGLELVEGKR
jgi:hypothetical protein